MKLLGFTSPASIGLIPLVLGGIGCSGGVRHTWWPLAGAQSTCHWVSAENKLFLTPYANNSTTRLLQYSAAFSIFNS